MFFKSIILLSLLIVVTTISKVNAKGGGRGGGGRGGGGRSSSGRSSSSGGGGSWFGGSKSSSGGSSSGSIKSGSSGSSGYYSGKSQYSSYNKNSGHNYHGQQQNYNYQPHYYRNPPQPDHQIRNHLAAGVAGAFIYSRLGHLGHSYHSHQYDRRDYHRNEKYQRELNGTYGDPVEKFERVHLVPFYTKHDNLSDNSDRNNEIDNIMIETKNTYNNDDNLSDVLETIDITDYIFKILKPKDTEILDISPDPILVNHRKYDPKTQPSYAIYDSQSTTQPPVPPGPEILPLFIHQIADADPFYFNRCSELQKNIIFLILGIVFSFLL